MSSSTIRYSVTGVVASERISPLLPSEWSNITSSPEIAPDFLWENAPRRETKDYRDTVKVYSHLPNGTSLLDSKWALGRLLSTAKEENNPLLATLETHCFRGLEGFQSFAKQVNLIGSGPPCQPFNITATDYPDIEKGLDLSIVPDVDRAPPLWVVKDAMANGAGGIWVVGPETASVFASPDSTPLHPEHKYVAQKYVWPPVLFGGRKCHVRVYGLLTSDGRAFIHHRAFLHVANDPFTTTDAAETGSFQDSIHITNCCANSHDSTKFAGEILADLELTESTERDGQPVIPLGAFFPSIRECISFLAKRAFPFLQGGHANHGFEYMGIDFMLSYNQANDPVAYILEINAPPSQDSATGLPHAENLHNEVIRDLISLWVLPNVTESPEISGGWRCVYTPCEELSSGELIVPSKGAIINKIKWSMFEKKAQRHDEETAVTGETGNGTESLAVDQYYSQPDVSSYARSCFPFFSDASSHRSQVFFENAGGSQVAQPVIDAVTESLKYRHRSMIGSKTKDKARECIRRILGTKGDEPVILGPNATALLATLADRYVRHGLLCSGDEVILSTENHSANFDPWLQAAKDTGATVKFWSPYGTRVDGTPISQRLEDLVTCNTRLVAMPHASNVLGQIRDLQSLSSLIKSRSQGYAHVVVDGVAAVPHHYADLQHLNHVDWYVISCHKLFGPHLGALCGNQRGAVQSFIATSSSGTDDNAWLYKIFESGTINYEGCAGVVGLGQYFASLASVDSDVDGNCGTKSTAQSSCESCDSLQGPHGELCAGSRPGGSFEKFLQDSRLTNEQVKEAYRLFRIAEAPLVTALLHGLGGSNKIRILGDHEADPPISCMVRLPTISFLHETIPPNRIMSVCEGQGISCRCCSFLCTTNLAEDLGFDHSEGIIRVSLAHYNTLDEVDAFFKAVTSIPGWF